jgi:hypothetical protein
MTWKYKVMTLSNDAQVNAKHLNELGSEGWELVAVHGHERAEFAFLKQAAVEPTRKIHL